MLELDGVSLRQQGRLCLDDVSLHLAPGTLLALAGPNGAGKTSLLKLASAEWRPDGGAVRLAGHDMHAMDMRQRARQLAVLPQASQLSFAFRVDEVVRLGRLPHASGQRRDAQIVREAMQLVGVADMAGALYPRLSGGEQRRVQIARALAQVWPDGADAGPRALLLDEPTAGLDWAHQLELLRNLRALAADGLAVLLVLHDLNLALRYADRVGLLQGGRLRALGAPEEVLQPGMIREVFAVEVQLQAHPRDGRPVIIQ